MKRGVFSLVVALLLVGCGEEQVSDFEVERSVALVSRSAVGVSDGYFAKVTDPAVWKTFQTLEEMQEACQIPAEELKKLSTEELLQICLEYPLAGNYLAYNDELQGIRAVMDGFNGFTELCQRDDAVEKLLNFYELYDVNACFRKQVPDAEFSDYPFIRLGYIELILASGQLKNMDLPQNVSRLKIANDRMTAVKKANPMYFGNLDLRRAALIDRRVTAQGNQSVDLTSSEFSSSLQSAKASVQTIYTICGKPVEALILPEMSYSQMVEVNHNCQVTYPNATMVGDASATYNCHSYAWNMKDGGPKCWINCVKIDNITSNLSIYWDRDAYIESVETVAAKVHYYNSDHSAIVITPSVLYESKWGQCPLMQHAPKYGPYENMNRRNYYVQRPTEHKPLIASYGTGETETGIRASYYVDNDIEELTGSKLRHYWVVYDAKGDDAIGVKAKVEDNGRWAYITFSQIGVYDIYYILEVPGERTFVDCMFQALVTQ